MSSVLLVEDNLLLCKLEKRYIQAAFPDVRLHVVHNGTDASLAVEEMSFDAVIMDCCLPKCDCVELLDDIVRTSPDAAIIIVSADPPKDVRNGSRREKIFDIIEKPFEAEELIEILKRALKKQMSVSKNDAAAEASLESIRPAAIFDRHEMLNILTGMMVGIRAFESDLASKAENSPKIRETIAEYVPKILKMVERATALIKQAKE